MAQKDKKNNPEKKDQDLLKQLEENMQQIECDEINQGMTQEELEDAGFIGDKEIKIKRKEYAETTEREKLTFAPGIEYERMPDTATYEELDYEKLIIVKEVKAGTLIATREPDEAMPFEAGIHVRKEVSETGERFLAEIKGKVVIIKDTMHLFPSDIDCELKIRVSEDKMAAYMDCKASYGDGKKLSYELVMADINKIGIVHGIMPDAIKKALMEAENLSVPQRDVIIAEGTPPASGDDSAVEYHFDIEDDSPSFKVLEDGRIDYKGSANIAVVKKGELLAEVKGANRGINGTTVLGEVILADKGKDVYLVAGKGVEESNDGRFYYADIKGCVVLHFPVIEVLEIYEVQGDVDYSTGSIDFNGSVIINGTVREGFEVKAEGDIIVQQSVESARITAGRDVRISGGILGHGKGLVSADRDVYAEYSQNGRIEAQGNVYINDFSVNSHISCKFLKMMSKHGSVVGGKIVAHRGIDVLRIGSPSGTKTHISTGTNFLVRKKIEELNSALEFYKKNIQKIETSLKPVMHLMTSDPDNPQLKSPLVLQTIKKRKELIKTQKVMHMKREHLAKEVEVQGVCFVKVKQTCFTDVYVVIKNLRYLNNDKRENIRFYEDQKENEIKIGAY